MSVPQDMIEAAIQASQHAYAPYSGYRVGAALRTLSGTLYTGCNVENAAYPVTICAERTALVKAISEGERDFDVLVVATRNGGEPCGMCRQMLAEFSLYLRVITVDFEYKLYLDTTLRSLLPHSFGTEDLD